MEVVSRERQNVRQWRVCTFDQKKNRTPTALCSHSLGEWDASRLDEDKLARKIGSSKAARMLGLTEDQV